MDPITLALLGLPAIYKGVQGLIQTNQAGKLKLRDSTPAAVREELALGRQAQTAALPGYGQQLDQLGAGQQSTLAAAARAGTSSSSILGLLSSSDQNRTRALAELSTRQDALHQQQNQRLGGLLNQQAQYQKADQQTLDTNRAALTQAGQTNIFGALDAGSQIAGYALTKQDAATAAATAATAKAGDATAAGLGLSSSPAGPDAVPAVDIYGRPLRNRYPVPHAEMFMSGGYGR